jgi:putative copper export protein
MDDLDTLIRFLHILGVTVWIGGLVFVGAVAVPVARADPDPARKRELITRIARRFTLVGGAAWVLILGTGMGILGRRDVSLGDLPDTDWGQRVLTKLVLLLAMGVVVLLHGAWQGPKVRRAEEAGDAATARRWKIVGAMFDAFTLLGSLAALWLATSLVA